MINFNKKSEPNGSLFLFSIPFYIFHTDVLRSPIAVQAAQDRCLFFLQFVQPFRQFQTHCIRKQFISKLINTLITYETRINTPHHPPAWEGSRRCCHRYLYRQFIIRKGNSHREQGRTHRADIILTFLFSNGWKVFASSNIRLHFSASTFEYHLSRQ